MCLSPNCLMPESQVSLFFFLGGVTATAPSRDLTDNKKEERGLKQRRKQKEAAQGDPEPKKGNQEKEKNPSRVELRERRTEDAEENQEDGRRRQTHEKGGETHKVAVVETMRKLEIFSFLKCKKVTFAYSSILHITKSILHLSIPKIISTKENICFHHIA